MLPAMQATSWTLLAAGVALYIDTAVMAFLCREMWERLGRTMLAADCLMAAAFYMRSGWLQAGAFTLLAVFRVIILLLHRRARRRLLSQLAHRA